MYRYGGETVLRRDVFVACHNYWARDTDFETQSRKHTDPRLCLMVHLHNTKMFYVPPGRLGEVYSPLKHWLACQVRLASYMPRPGWFWHIIRASTIVLRSGVIESNSS